MIRPVSCCGSMTIDPIVRSIKKLRSLPVVSGKDHDNGKPRIPALRAYQRGILRSGRKLAIRAFRAAYGQRVCHAGSYFVAASDL